jgi:hypothetical protein
MIRTTVGQAGDQPSARLTAIEEEEWAVRAAFMAS